MTDELVPTEQEEQKQKMNVNVQGGGSSPVYGLGMIGAWVFYIGRATTTQERVRGFLKELSGRRTWSMNC